MSAASFGTTPAAATAHTDGERRRIVLMRHGSVDYFRDDGTPISPEGVPLSETGRRQAIAAGELFAQAGVRFDRVIASGLARTLETAALALAACGQQETKVEVETALQEIRGGRLSAIPRDRLVSAFLGAFGGDDEDGDEGSGGSDGKNESGDRSAGAVKGEDGRRSDDGDADLGDAKEPGAASPVPAGSVAESKRFLGGETVGELLDRVLPAFERVLARDDWHTLLMVLHGGVNRVLLSRALAGGRAFFGGLEQSPACINLIDVPPPGGRGRMVVRAVNLAPTHWLHEGERQTTMEKLLAQYLRRFEPQRARPA